MVCLGRTNSRGEPVAVIVEEACSRSSARTNPRLRRALVAAYGVERGKEAVAEALAYAWERWVGSARWNTRFRISYHVGQSRTRQRKTRVVFTMPEHAEPWVEPQLASTLANLSERQQLAVVLVFGFGWRLPKSPKSAGFVSPPSRTISTTGLARLRTALEVEET